MNKIIITEQDGAMHIDPTGVQKNVSDGEYLGILIETYMAEARRIISLHNCGNPDCCLKELHHGVIASISSTVNLHNLGHNHD